ncbi:MAG: sulfurtransferase-like selenium metabolism protein YedF [Oscillospiraceae bacterium]
MKTIDAKGKACPLPVVMAKKEIESGTTNFDIIVDNMIAVNNIEKLVKTKGAAMSHKEENGMFIVSISTSGENCEECEAILDQVAVTPKGHWTLFVSKEFMGSGDDILGKKLIDMFLYTLTQTDDLPENILFMNGGVKIPSNDEQAIEHLNILKDMGVRIVVCGTCLNFFGLENELKVGEISNMYEITDQMQKSPKVITL